MFLWSALLIGAVYFETLDAFYIGRSALRHRTVFSPDDRPTASTVRRITVLQEEPFLYSNGDGFFPEFLQQFSKSFQETTGQKFLYQIVPVSTWTELNTASRNDLAFGLFNGREDESEDQWNGVFRSQHFLDTSHSLLVRSDFDNFLDTELVVVKDSPFEYLLKNKLKHTGPTYTAPTSEEALQYLKENQRTVFYTESLLANYNAERFPEDFQHLCTGNIEVGQDLMYSFFGGTLDSTTQTQINRVMTVAHAASQPIIDKNFGIYTLNDECKRK